MVATTGKANASGKLDTQRAICPRCGEFGFLAYHWAKDQRYWYYYFIHKNRVPPSCYLGKNIEKWNRLREEAMK